MEETKKQPEQKNIGMAIVAYILFFVPLLTDSKNDPFVKYHVKQGLVLFLTSVFCSVIASVPVVGWVLAPFLWVGLLVLLVMGILNVINGKQEPLPFIGKYSNKFNI